ncbi:TRAP transporter large permease [Fretibacterium sp. OH1220_COT-178]|uniref:TRAP transporter large permease n=1 Tax=Fretibacterium sp. OH1220_COT-178 TaxID=2491047 RepID=UPI000F5D6D59|nr:TRAP transporter large permease [Fretibacterium sp. OH1220_COT-178]RRD65158.1 TRAP transporter large permease [Fretibacterium sp. OH1220_COT-178]
MIAFVLIGVFFGLLLLRVPVAASMGLAALAGILQMGFKISVFPTVFYAAIARYTLLAIPFFILAGVIMDHAGISGRLIAFANACVGHRKGGLAVVTVVVACFFAAISGSGPATVAAIGGVLIPAMVRQGYDKDFATALVASSGGIGMIIPPSIPFIIYAMLAEVSVGTMFIAGIVPGLLFGLFFSAAALLCLRADANVVRQARQPAGVRWRTFREALWALMMPVIILGGIYGGVFTPTEAAGVAVVYGLLVGLFVYREIKLRQLWRIFVEASVSSAVIMFIMGCAGAFTWILTTSGVAGQLTGALLSVTRDRTAMLLLITLIFLIAGCFVDSASGFYLLMPILLPIVREMNYSLIAFGVIATANFAIGQVTPPVGSNLFVACNIAKVSMRDLVAKVWPFLIAGVLCLLLITFLPWLITFLPAAMGMRF